MSLQTFSSSSLFNNLKACNPIIQSLDPNTQNDKESVLAAIFLSGNGSLLQQASLELRRDKDLVSSIVAVDPSGIRNAAPELSENPEFILEISSKYPNILYYINHAKVKDEQVRKRYLELRKYSSHAIEVLYESLDVLEENEELAKAAVTHNPMLLVDMQKLGEKKELALLAVEHNPMAVNQISDSFLQDVDFMKQAIAKDASSFSSSRLEKNSLDESETNAEQEVELVKEFLKGAHNHPAAYFAAAATKVFDAIESNSAIARFVTSKATKEDLIEVLSKGLWINSFLEDPDEYKSLLGDKLNVLTKEDWLAILKDNYLAFNALPSELKGDKELVKISIQETPELYGLIPRELRMDKQIALAALTLNPLLEDFPSDFNSDAEFWIQAYKQTKYPTLLTLNADPTVFNIEEIKVPAILSLKGCRTETLVFMKNRISYEGEEADNLLATDPRFILFLDCPTTEQCIYAAKNGYPKAVKEIDIALYDEMKPEEMKELVKLHPNILTAFSSSTIGKENIREFTLLAIECGGTNESFILEDDETAMLKLLRNNGKLYNEIDRDLRARREFAAAALSSKKNTTRSYPKLFRSSWINGSFALDKLLMKDYVKFDQMAYEILPEVMKADPEIAINAMMANPRNVCYLPDALSQNMTFILKLVAAVPNVLDYTSFSELQDSIKNEKNIALAAVATDAEYIKKFDPAIQFDIDVLIAAIGSKKNSHTVKIPSTLVVSNKFQSRALEAATINSMLSTSRGVESLALTEQTILNRIDRDNKLLNLSSRLHHTAVNNRIAKHLREALAKSALTNVFTDE